MQVDGDNTAWRRLLDYRDELADVCDRVSGELVRNRRVREDWMLRTDAWKKIWLPDKADPEA